MKKIAAFATMLAIGASLIAPASAAAPGCLWTRQIDRTTVIDPKTILFHMKDGKVYRNTLQSPCLGLQFNGFAYVLHSDELCGESQSIHVLQTKEVCTLGKFVPETIGRHG